MQTRNFRRKTKCPKATWRQSGKAKKGEQPHRPPTDQQEKLHPITVNKQRNWATSKYSPNPKGSCQTYTTNKAVSTEEINKNPKGKENSNKKTRSGADLNPRGKNWESMNLAKLTRKQRATEHDILQKFTIKECKTQAGRTQLRYPDMTVLDKNEAREG